MVGDGCFAIASDLRFGQELKTVTCDFPKAFEMSPNLWMGLTGLATDVQVILVLLFSRYTNNFSQTLLMGKDCKNSKIYFRLSVKKWSFVRACMSSRKTEK